MNKIFQILIKNHVFFLFITLQIISLIILKSNNFIIESTFVKKSNEISGKLFYLEGNIKNYFKLEKTNRNLLQENLCLIKENHTLKKKIELNKDSTINSEINIITAKVLKNSWNKKQNFMVINKGSKMLVEKNMGVLYKNNLAGIIYSVSDNFSTIISLINTNLSGVSAKIKHSGHFGMLNWDGIKFNKMQLHNIPKHANIKIGDTIVTSGYTNIFPENINIGVIEKFQLQKNTNFFDISVHLFTDFSNIEYVYIMPNKIGNERFLIEKTIEN